MALRSDALHITSRGFADDESRCVHDFARGAGVGRGLYPLQKQIDGALCNERVVRIDGRERRDAESGFVDVVEPYDLHVLRHSNAAICEPADHAKRDGVGRGEDAVELEPP